MAEKVKRKVADGRTSPGPRFNCGGLAKISRLPSDGIFLRGKMFGLKLGGCRIDTALPIERGVRAEWWCYVNATSFRAVGEVEGDSWRIRGVHKFVYLSCGGKDMLAAVVAELAKSQASMNGSDPHRRGKADSRNCTGN